MPFCTRSAEPPASMTIRAAASRTTLKSILGNAGGGPAQCGLTDSRTRSGVIESTRYGPAPIASPPGNLPLASAAWRAAMPMSRSVMSVASGFFRWMRTRRASSRSKRSNRSASTFEPSAIADS
jgi:hypothetical protein